METSDPHSPSVVRLEMYFLEPEIPELASQLHLAHILVYVKKR